MSDQHGLIRGGGGRDGVISKLEGGITVRSCRRWISEWVGLWVEKCLGWICACGGFREIWLVEKTFEFFVKWIILQYSCCLIFFVNDVRFRFFDFSTISSLPLDSHTFVSRHVLHDISQSTPNTIHIRLCVREKQSIGSRCGCSCWHKSALATGNYRLQESFGVIDGFSWAF